MKYCPTYYTDRGLRDDSWILKKIWDENTSQIIKWGIQSKSAWEWLTFTTEELGELAKAIADYEYGHGPREEVVKEAIQVATLALKIAEMFERNIVANRADADEEYIDTIL